MTLDPGWLQRQLDNVERDIAQWPRWMRREAKFEERQMSRQGIIEATSEARCEMCGKESELRPYGPKGENVCFACGMKDPAAVERGMNRLLFGEGNA